MHTLALDAMVQDTRLLALRRLDLHDSCLTSGPPNLHEPRCRSSTPAWPQSRLHPDYPLPSTTRRLQLLAALHSIALSLIHNQLLATLSYSLPSTAKEATYARYTGVNPSPGQTQSPRPSPFMTAQTAYQ